MNEQKKTKNTMWIFILILGVVITAGAIFAVINKQPSENGYVEQAEATTAVVADVANNTLEDIIKTARTWEAAFKPWYGKTATEFTVTDIKGKKHSLSGYRGRNVMVVFWATWCPPCNVEVPNLIELRKQIGEDKLAIIAISNENPETVKAFVNAKGINYTVASVTNNALPSPFSDVSSIPTAFYIDRNGKIKLATVGTVELDDIKAILKAES